LQTTFYQYKQKFLFFEFSPMGIWILYIFSILQACTEILIALAPWRKDLCPSFASLRLFIVYQIDKSVMKLWI
jgi:hypothetical protein